jgi:acetylglutamate kinase|eukprot:scaffold2612_cov267-Chaetoceros_neogracile.AAC.88
MKVRNLAILLSLGTINAFTVQYTQSIKRSFATSTPTALFDQIEPVNQFAENAITISNAVSSLAGETIVIKYGGNAMTSPELAKGFCEDIAALQKLGMRVVVVHGGGPQIKAMLEKVGVESRFEGGMRVSSKEVVEVAEMVLCGSVNKQISSGICSAGGIAIGLSGRDADLLQCEKLLNKDGIDLGNVGEVKGVNTDLLNNMLDLGITPVVSPIGTGIGDEKDVAYNCNADVAAGRIAGELKASRVLFLTDIAGVLDKEMKLLKELSIQDVNDLIDDDTITGGMIPKVSYATDAIKLGVKGAFITDGRVPHAVLNEILAGGADGKGSGEGGTIITM